MISLLAALVRREEAQDLAEYGIALGVIAAVVVTLAVFIGQDINTLWAKAQTQITNVVNGE